jgi:hypothetical protein
MSSVRRVVILSLFLLILGFTAGYLLRDMSSLSAIQEKDAQIAQLREETERLAVSNKKLMDQSWVKKGGE